MDESELGLWQAMAVGSQEPSFPVGKRLPRGWAAARVGGRSEPLQLKWPAGAADRTNGVTERANGASEAGGFTARLRLAIALDFRAVSLVEVYLLGSGEILGRLDIRYAYVFQPFELSLTVPQALAALREGVGVRHDRELEDRPLWILCGRGFGDADGVGLPPSVSPASSASPDSSRAFLMPHLWIGEMTPSRLTNRFLQRFTSVASLQPFGWMEGCVLDGLYALQGTHEAERAEKALEAHLRQYLDEDGSLHYEDLHGLPADGRFTTIEATLPLAVIVKRWPEHSIVAKSLSFWDSRGAAGGGGIVDGRTVSAEGAYTVAYPLAATAVRLGRKDLAVRSLVQLLLRRDRLAEGEHVWLRYHQQSGERSFRSWSRAYAWYMLGMTRTWLELQSSRYAGLPGMDEIGCELRRVADVALRWRQPGTGGLWTCFLDQPDTGIETSGSSGIAAAMALGARHGLLPERYMDIAGECLHALEAFLTPDGILSGVSQHNAGGVELQTGGYRVLSQMGMGLMASLYSAIHAKA